MRNGHSSSSARSGRMEHVRSNERDTLVHEGVPAIGVPDSQVLTSAAQASLISRMVDVESGSILWSGRMSYEGLDTQTTMAGITSSFPKSLVPLCPPLPP